MEDFLRYVAISQEGIYTILGSKPMTEFYIPKLQSEKERKELYDRMPEEFRKKVLFSRFNTDTEITELWEQWVKIQDKYIGEHFRIVFDQEMQTGFLLNIPLVFYTLQKHYHDFSQVLGKDFNPADAAREIGWSTSSFWTEVKKKHNLMGLLFGFGEKNAQLFQWEMDKKISFPFRTSSEELPLIRKKTFSRYGKIENLTIPQFIVYQPVDEVVEKYLLERKRILQIYKGKDFAETTVRYLRGEGISDPSKKKMSLRVL